MEDYSSEISFPLELVFIQDGNALFHSLIYFLSISWYPKKIYFSLPTHTTQILLKLKRGVRVDVTAVHFGRIRSKKSLVFSAAGIR